MRTRAQVILAAAAILSTTLAFADDIQLKNGQRYSGSVSRVGDKMVIQTDDGRTISVAPNDIAAVNLNDAVTPAQAASAEWTRIVQRIKNADNLQTIITLHKDFLDKFPDAPQADGVKSSLEVYQKLAENDGVKFRGRWLPRAQIEVMVRQWKESAKRALDLYHQGQYKDAIEAAKSTLAGDGQNPDALTVAGLSAYRMNDARVARTYFTSLAAADPTSLIAENNLAIVAGVQKQPAEGLIHYTRALAINPENRLLLDNIEEALAAYVAGGGEKDAPPYGALLRQFNPAEKKMEDRMARQPGGGLFSWGASWVSKPLLDKLDAYTVKAEAEAKQLDSQYKTAQQVLGGIENQMKAADQDMENALDALNYYDAQLALGGAGQAVSPVWLATQRDVTFQNYARAENYKTQLQAEHDTFVAETKDFFAQADKIKAILLSAGDGAIAYSGKQRIMEVGDDENPPPPAAVKEPPALPDAPTLPAIVLNTAPIQPPTAVPVLIPTHRAN